MPTLVATKPLLYAGQSLNVGDEFEASEKDAKILKAIRKAEDAPEAAEDHETFGDPLSGEMQEHYNRVVNLVIGEPVVVIGDNGIPGLLAGSAVRGSLISIDTSDPRFAFIDVTESGGPPQVRANISRVFAASDPSILIVP